MLKRLLPAVLVMFLAPFVAAEDNKPVTVTFTPLGDSEACVVVRISFRFAVPGDVMAGSGMVLQGSLMQGGKVVRNFRYPVIAEDDGATSTVQALQEGPIEVETRLIAETEDTTPLLLGKTTDTYTVVKTNTVYVADADDGAEAMLAEGTVPDVPGAVKIRAPRRDVAIKLFIVEVETL